MNEQNVQFLIIKSINLTQRTFILIDTQHKIDAPVNIITHRDHNKAT
jgi:hypothetical protein